MERGSSLQKGSPIHIFPALTEGKAGIEGGHLQHDESSKTEATSVRNFLQNLETSSEHLEASLNTVLQSVRGTKAFWNLRRLDLECMVRKVGTPTLFLTFSCAEYKSVDISEYLRMMNDVPAGYDIGKLCTEDPVSVSRQFSRKFHVFFNSSILNGQPFGILTLRLLASETSLYVHVI